MSKTLSELFDERIARDAETYGIKDVANNGKLPNVFQDVHYKAGAQSVKPILMELDETLNSITKTPGGCYGLKIEAEKARAKLRAWLEGGQV